MKIRECLYMYAQKMEEQKYLFIYGYERNFERM